jgi:LacI family transcriptional regulator
MTTNRKPERTDNRLGNWGPNERRELAARLRCALIPASGKEQLLWGELLRRLERSEGPLNTDDAARIMGVYDYDNTEMQNTVNSVASHLRHKVEALAETLSPNPGVFLSRQTYAILVTQDPPPDWKYILPRSIGLLLADAADWFVGNLLLGVMDACNGCGYDLVLEVSNGDSMTEATKLRHLLERTDGVLMVPVSESALDADSRKLLRERHCVLVDRYLRDSADVLSVHHDDISAGRQAGLYLKENGCSRVLIVDQASRSPSRFDITPLIDRVKGCKLQLHGEIKTHCLLAAGSDEQGGFDALEQFERKVPLTSGDGIFALTDRLALGCRHYLNTRKPPLNLPLIGSEGQAFGDFLEPPLVSIGFDVVEMGRRAANVLFAKLQNLDLPATDCLPHFLIEPTLLKASPGTQRRVGSPINFPDAAVHYATKVER